MKPGRNRLEELVLEELAALLEQKPLHTELPVASRGGKLQRKAPSLKYWTQRGEAQSIDDKDPEHKMKFSSLDAQGRTPSGERAVGSITMDQAKARDKEAAVPSRMATGGVGVHSVKGGTKMYSTERSKTRRGKTDSKHGKGFSSEFFNVGNKPDTVSPISGVTPEQAKKHDISGYDPKTGRGEMIDTWAAGADRTVSHGYGQELYGDPSAKQLKKGYEKMGGEAGFGQDQDLGGAKQWQDKGYKGAYQGFRYGTTPGAQRKTVKGPSLGVDTKIGAGIPKSRGRAAAEADRALKGTFGMRGLEESTMKLDRNRLEELIQEELADLLEQRPLAKAPAHLAGAAAQAKDAYKTRHKPEDKVGDWKQVFHQRTADGKTTSTKGAFEGPKQEGEWDASDAAAHAKSKTGWQDPGTSHVRATTAKTYKQHAGTAGSPQPGASRSKSFDTESTVMRGQIDPRTGNAVHRDRPRTASSQDRIGHRKSRRTTDTSGGDTKRTGKRSIQHFGRDRTTYKNMGDKFKDMSQGEKMKRARDRTEESTMKLSRNDLKQLVQEEVGVLLEQPAAAGVDTSAVQQSGKVTQILRIIDGMREDEISALLTAMKSAGLPIAM